MATPRAIGGVNFDGTAAIVPQTIESANEATDTTCFPLFITASGTQQLQPKNNTALTFNSNTASLGCTTFVGALTGNASTATALATARAIGGVNFDGTAAIVPQTIESANEGTDTTCFPLFITASGTQQLQPKNNTALTFNSNTGALGATSFSGAGTGLTGTASGLSIGGNAATVTTNANLTGAITSSGNATSLGSFSSANLITALTDETGSNKAVFSTAPTFDSTITVGTAAGTTGAALLRGTTSGVVTLSVADAAGTWTMKLPTTGGTNQYFLQTDGSGNTTWAPAAGSGTVTSASVVSANGFAGSVATATTTPAITISTTITGVIKGNGTAISAATAGTDYVAPGTATTFTAQQVFGAASLTDASPITWNLATQQSAKVLLTSGVGGTRQLQNPTNMVDGGTYILKITQSATGSNALTYGNAYKWPGGVAPVLSTANNAIDILTFISDGTNMYGVAQKAFA